MATNQTNSGKKKPRWRPIIIFVFTIVPGGLAGGVFGAMIGGFSGDGPISDFGVLAYTIIFGLLGTMVGAAVGLAPALLVYFAIKALTKPKKASDNHLVPS